MGCCAGGGCARLCVARLVVHVGGSAGPGMCGARSAEKYLGRTSEEVAARARERGIVPFIIIIIYLLWIGIEL